MTATAARRFRLCDFGDRELQLVPPLGLQDRAPGRCTAVFRRFALALATLWYALLMEWFAAGFCRSVRHYRQHAWRPGSF